MRVPRLKPGDICLVQQKAFTGKHKIGYCSESTKYAVVNWQQNLPVYTIKPWQGDEGTMVIHRNLLMHIASHHQPKGMQSGLKDSDYDTIPGDEELSKEPWVQLD